MIDLKDTAVHAITVILAVMLGLPLLRADEKEPIKMLFIGNSMTQMHDIPGQLKEMAESGDPARMVETMRVIYGGRTPEQHWTKFRTHHLLQLPDLTKEDLQAACGDMTREMELDQKSENPNEVKHAVKYLDAIRNHQEWMNLLENPPTWDFVVLQSFRDEQGGLESSYATYARKFAKLIHERNAKMVLYATATSEQNGVPLTELPDPEPVMEKARYHARLANELDALVIPVSLAIHRLREKRLDLTTQYRNNGHLNQTCAYLTLCCFYAAVFDQSPVGLSMREINKGTTRVDPEGKSMHVVFDPETAAHLQQAAWDAVREIKALQEELKQEHAGE